MKKDLPSIYKNNVTKKNTHNKNVFYVKNDDENNRQVEVLEEIDVEEKLRKLFKSSRYVFNIGVIIKTNRGDYDTKIAGKITIPAIIKDFNGVTIPIIEIKDIIIKDRL